MTESTVWKTATLEERTIFGKEISIPVRTDGTVFQIWESRNVYLPFAEKMDSWMETLITETAGLVEKTIDFDAIPCDGQNCGGTPESYLFVSGWREELTEAEKEAVATLTFL
jgi:hypothetical protein